MCEQSLELNIQVSQWGTNCGDQFSVRGKFH
jgi:hypothetical protein